MISKAERQHVIAIKEWSSKSRSELKQLQADSTFGQLLRSILPDTKAEAVFDNVDWLVTLIEREEHRYSVKAFRHAIESYKE